MYQCPKCKAEEGSFQIHNIKEINLGDIFVSDNGDVYDDKFRSSEQEYDGTNQMTCLECNHEGVKLEFEVNDDE